MKYIKFVILSVICLFFIPISCFASTNEFPRSKENPLVPENVTVTDANIQDILNTPAVDSSEKIYDFAQLYSEDEEKELYKEISNYIKTTKYDLVVVTTDSLKGYSIGNYANNFYTFNKFQKTGIVFVVSIGGFEPELFMGNIGDTSEKIFSIYTHSRINQTLKYIYTDIRKGNYYNATEDYLKILQGFFDIEDGNYQVNSHGQVVKSIPWIPIAILGISLTFIICICMIYTMKLHNKNLFNSNLERKIDSSTFNIQTEVNELITNYGRSINKK